MLRLFLLMKKTAESVDLFPIQKLSSVHTGFLGEYCLLVRKVKLLSWYYLSVIIELLVFIRGMFVSFDVQENYDVNAY